MNSPTALRDESRGAPALHWFRKLRCRSHGSQRRAAAEEPRQSRGEYGAFFRLPGARTGGANRQPPAEGRSTGLRSLDGPRFRRILVQPKVCPALVIIRNEATEVVAQVPLSGDEHVIQTLATNRANHPLDLPTLPRRAGCRQHFGHSQCGDLIDEVATKNAIPISQQIARCRIPRKGFAELLGGPRRRRMIRDADVQNPAAVVRQHEEDVEHLEADRRDGEEVHGHRGREVIF